MLSGALFLGAGPDCHTLLPSGLPGPCLGAASSGRLWHLRRSPDLYAIALADLSLSPLSLALPSHRRWRYLLLLHLHPTALAHGRPPLLLLLFLVAAILLPPVLRLGL